MTSPLMAAHRFEEGLKDAIAAETAESTLR
jgi:hypothetical protein